MKTSKKAARYQVHLSSADRLQCEAVLRGGHCWVWRAKLLLAMDHGKRRAREAGERVGMCENAALLVVKRYLAKRDLEYALADEERPGGKAVAVIDAYTFAIERTQDSGLRRELVMGLADAVQGDATVRDFIAEHLPDSPL